MTKLRPINNHVLVEPVKKEETKTAAGVIIPEVNSKASRNRLEKGIVKNVPNITDPELPSLKIGELVYFKPGTGHEVLIDEKIHLIIPIVQLPLVLEAE